MNDRDNGHYPECEWSKHEGQCNCIEVGRGGRKVGVAMQSEEEQALDALLQAWQQWDNFLKDRGDCLTDAVREHWENFIEQATEADRCIEWKIL